MFLITWSENVFPHQIKQLNMKQKRVKDNDIAAVLVFILLLCMFLSTIITKRAEKNKTVDYKSEGLERTIAKG